MLRMKDIEIRIDDIKINDVLKCDAEVDNMTPEKCKTCKYYFNCLCGKGESYRLPTEDMAETCGEK